MDNQNILHKPNVILFNDYSEYDSTQEYGQATALSVDRRYSLEYNEANNQTGGIGMENQEYFKILREDRQQLEERLAESQRQLEERLDSSYQRMDERLTESLRQLGARLDSSYQRMDERLTESQRQLEERLENRYQRMDERLTRLQEQSEARQEKQLEEYRRWNIERMEIQEKMFDKMSTDINAAKWSIIALCITVILSVAGLVIAVITSVPK